MIEYRLMQGSLVLPSCLHRGAIHLAQLPELAAHSPVEKQFDLRAGVHARFLREICRLYGACGILALDGDRIVGKQRFCPKLIDDMVPFCMQEEDSAKKIADLDPGTLPLFQDLEPKSLAINCHQVIPDYQSQGIGRTMLEKTVAWARETGWQEIRAVALAPIFPLLAWSGNMSVQSLARLGFEIVGRKRHEGLKEAATAQRLGYHGEAIQRVWQEQYAHLSDDDAAWLYDMRLAL